MGTMNLRVGVDLGATKIQTLLVASDGSIVARKRGTTPATGGPSAVLTRVQETIEQLLVRADQPATAVATIGIGAPGQIDAAAGVVLQAVNIAGWDQPVPVAGIVGDMFGVPVALANDVQASIVAEHRLGAGRGRTNLLGIFCGTGVGGGLILNGELWLGGGAAGEIGHTVVVQAGRQCGCGRNGCLEAYAGRGALEQTARLQYDAGRPTVLFDLMEQQGRTRLTSRVWLDACLQSDELASGLITEAARAVGTAAGSAANLLDIDCVVIGGGLATRLGDRFLGDVRAAAQPVLLRPETANQIVLSELGDDCGALGAALLAGDRLAGS
ncbi:MAG: ROK family protein [Thermoleophilia bacterium]|nr:ROK family protein [Thermoleophilia bacterium]